MDFKSQLKQISDRINDQKQNILTEEATKNAFIMPFINALGYDVFNPLEVVPEYIADLGIKKGEKIDYAIFKDSKISILVECKDWRQNLNLHDGQLLRYFHVSKARFGLLTNGIEYRFYSDLVNTNKMDEKPFLQFNITEIKDIQIDELKKFHKDIFDADSIASAATELKYINEIKLIFNQEINNPSVDFVRHFAKQVYPSIVSAKVIEQFTVLTKKSIQQSISDLITERLSSALKKENEKLKTETTEEPEIKIITTEEEINAYYIVKSILRTSIASSRITYRDAQSYFSILLDDNNRRPICRLYLNSTKKYIAIFDDNKKEQKIEIESIDNIYDFSEQIINTTKSYI